MKRFFHPATWTFLLVALVPMLLASCEETDNDTSSKEYANWRVRNDAFFAEKMQQAREAEVQARATFGDDWKMQTPWRAELSYAKVASDGLALTDSICWEYVTHGADGATAYYTDSVRVNYRGTLMPTDEHPQGYVFDHSGLYDTDEFVFSEQYSVPVAFAVSNLVEGFTTVLHHLHVGDRVKVYIPYDLGYGKTAATGRPAYSTLIFEVEVCGIYRAGEVLGSWH